MLISRRGYNRNNVLSPNRRDYNWAGLKTGRLIADQDFTVYSAWHLICLLLSAANFTLW